MKRTKFLPAIFALLLFAVLLAPPEAAEAAGEAKAECVVEISSRRILHELNAETPLPMASTTKVLTAILILDDCDIEEEVVIPHEAEGVEGSSVYLRAGEVYTVRDLLYGLMLRSGNDCAVALALHHSGSIEKFAAAMNEKAALLGAEESNFVNPHGLPDKRHRTTARDLALISAYAMENETFRAIVSCKFYEPRGWKNKNKMLWEYEGAIGVKTGFTLSAGRCLVTSAERNGMKLVCVVLSCPEMYERTGELLDKAYAEYALCPLCDSGQTFEGMGIQFGFSYPLKEAERGEVRTEIEKYALKSPKAGEVGGIMRIFLKNDLIFSQNLYIIKP